MNKCNSKYHESILCKKTQFGFEIPNHNENCIIDDDVHVFYDYLL